MAYHYLSFMHSDSGYVGLASPPPRPPCHGARYSVNLLFLQHMGSGASGRHRLGRTALHPS
eukprot:12271067-Heterocapsa_arctica.AAC.1